MKQKKTHKNPLPRLYLISGGKEDAKNSTSLLDQLHLIPNALPCMIQIREKNLAAGDLLTLALKAREVELPAGSLLLINERLDIALAAELDGVHLPENALLPDKHGSYASELIFGCSIHSHESLRIAESSGADYLLFGPVFDTPSKRQYGPPQGLEKLGKLCKATLLPVFALGGITPENAALCMAEGAYGAAGLSIFQSTPRLTESLEQFYDILYQ